ncbi:MAG TPA: MXAN_5187 C-terminal domain-containing protein [Candidatus Acidoferrales bacterium]|nr:MXAN_5187 C-terminal domain-containing protein [Candidatus Acidoferrales bacterium]
MATTPEEDLVQLEKDIRTLKIEYEQFFGGGRKRPPADTQWRVESLIKRYSDRGAQMSYSQRFRYTNIAQTFAKYCEIWRKKIKEREEGTTHRHFGAAAKAIEAQRASSVGVQEPKGAPKSERVPAFAMSFTDPDHEAKKIEQLYQKLVEVRTATGEKGGTPSFEDFGKFVRQKTRELKGKQRAVQVEYTVSVEDGRVKLKARVSG